MNRSHAALAQALHLISHEAQEGRDHQDEACHQPQQPHFIIFPPKTTPEMLKINQKTFKNYENP